MKTPEEMWVEYRDFVYFDTDIPIQLDEEELQERQRAFYAGSEAVFRVMECYDGQSGVDAVRALGKYREQNQMAAMETVPPEERE